MFAIIRAIRQVANELREFGIKQAATNFYLDARETLDRHLTIGIGGSISGIYLRLPFTRLSLWLEWREVDVGLGVERSTGTIEFFLGRLQGVACIEPVEA